MAHVITWESGTSRIFQRSISEAVSSGAKQENAEDNSCATIPNVKVVDKKEMCLVDKNSNNALLPSNWTKDMEQLITKGLHQMNLGDPKLSGQAPPAVKLKGRSRGRARRLLQEVNRPGIGAQSHDISAKENTESHVMGREVNGQQFEDCSEAPSNISKSCSVSCPLPDVVNVPSDRLAVSGAPCLNSTKDSQEVEQLMQASEKKLDCNGTPDVQQVVTSSENLIHHNTHRIATSALNSQVLGTTSLDGKKREHHIEKKRRESGKKGDKTCITEKSSFRPSQQASKKNQMHSLTGGTAKRTGLCEGEKKSVIHKQNAEKNRKTVCQGDVSNNQGDQTCQISGFLSRENGKAKPLGESTQGGNRFSKSVNSKQRFQLENSDIGQSKRSLGNSKQSYTQEPSHSKCHNHKLKEVVHKSSPASKGQKKYQAETGYLTREYKDSVNLNENWTAQYSSSPAKTLSSRDSTNTVDEELYKDADEVLKCGLKEEASASLSPGLPSGVGMEEARVYNHKHCRNDFQLHTAVRTKKHNDQPDACGLVDREWGPETTMDRDESCPLARDNGQRAHRPSFEEIKSERQLSETMSCYYKEVPGTGHFETKHSCSEERVESETRDDDGILHDKLHGEEEQPRCGTEHENSYVCEFAAEKREAQVKDEVRSESWSASDVLSKSSEYLRNPQADLTCEVNPHYNSHTHTTNASSPFKQISESVEGLHFSSCSPHVSARGQFFSDRAGYYGFIGQQDAMCPCPTPVRPFFQQGMNPKMRYFPFSGSWQPRLRLMASDMESPSTLDKIVNFVKCGSKAIEHVFKENLGHEFPVEVEVTLNVKPLTAENRSDFVPNNPVQSPVFQFQPQSEAGCLASTAPFPFGAPVKNNFRHGSSSMQPDDECSHRYNQRRSSFCSSHPGLTVRTVPEIWQNKPIVGRAENSLDQCSSSDRAAPFSAWDFCPPFIMAGEHKHVNNHSDSFYSAACDLTNFSTHRNTVNSSKAETCKNEGSAEGISMSSTGPWTPDSAGSAESSPELELKNSPSDSRNYHRKLCTLINRQRNPVDLGQTGTHVSPSPTGQTRTHVSPSPTGQTRTHMSPCSTDQTGTRFSPDQTRTNVSPSPTGQTRTYVSPSPPCKIMRPNSKSRNNSTMSSVSSFLSPQLLKNDWYFPCMTSSVGQCTQKTSHNWSEISERMHYKSGSDYYVPAKQSLFHSKFQGKLNEAHGKNSHEQKKGVTCSLEGEGSAQAASNSEPSTCELSALKSVPNHSLTVCGNSEASNWRAFCSPVGIPSHPSPVSATKDQFSSEYSWDSRSEVEPNWPKLGVEANRRRSDSLIASYVPRHGMKTDPRPFTSNHALKGFPLSSGFAHSERMLKTIVTGSPSNSDYARELGRDHSWKRTFVQRSEHYQNKFIDSHCHIDFIYKRAGIDSYTSFRQFKANHSLSFPVNYEGCVAVFCNPQTFAPVDPRNKICLNIAQEEGVWLALGCHPKNATDFTNSHLKSLKAALQHPKVVALGEIGLDYSGTFRKHENVQKQVFRSQIELAVDLNLPLVIHCREADADCLAIMQELIPRQHKIHAHCFTRDFEMAMCWLQAFPNLFLGLTPLIAYDSALEAKDTARNIPLDRLLLETDAPYFTPKGLRREHTAYTHPGFALYTAEQVADLQGVTVDCVLKACRENTYKMYGI